MSTVTVAPSVSDLLDASPKHSIRVARVIGSYLIAYLFCFIIAHTDLSRREAVSLQFLTRSTFLYAGSDHASSSFAPQLANRLHLHTLDLLCPGAGKTVYPPLGTCHSTP